MELICFPLLGTRSRRAMLRVKKKFGHPYTYNPNASLIQRLSLELNSDKDTIIKQLHKEREYLIKERNR